MRPPGSGAPRGEVHVWNIDLRPDAERFGRAQRILTPDEVQTARRFGVEADRYRFVVGRAALRTILARYVNRAAGELRFGYGERGKPRLIDAPALHFNLAHAHELGLCAVAGDREVGI